MCLLKVNLTAALSGTKGVNAAFCLKSLPTHALSDIMHNLLPGLLVILIGEPKNWQINKKTMI